jgi:hypothetical protein
VVLHREWYNDDIFFDCSNYLSFHRNGKFPITSDNETSFQEAPNSEIYNGMIYPYTRMVIKGVLWYQGRATERVVICLML